MAKRKARSHRRSGSDTESLQGKELHEGQYPISTGMVELRRDPYDDQAWEIYVNGVPSSHISADPTQLSYEYMRWIAAYVTQFVADNPPPYALRVTHCGGGACSLARWFVHTYPGSKNTVVEIDGELAQLVRQWFALPKAPALKIRVGDAAAVVPTFREASRDIIIRDVFAPDRTPLELCTQEFHEQCLRSLSDSGLYIANCGDHRDLSHARAELHTMLQVYPHVAAIADPAMLKGRRYGNIILLGARRPLPASPTLERTLRTDAIPAQFRDHQWCEKFASAGQIYRGAATASPASLSHASTASQSDQVG